MLSQSADYALRATLFLAQRDGHRAFSCERIARGTGVPRNYLGKVLNSMVRSGVLHSVRGPRGGFALAVDPERLTLEDVIAPFQPLPERQVCLLGNRRCDAKQPCGVHLRWQSMAAPYTEFFRQTTVALMLQPIDDELSSTPSNGGTHEQ